MPAKTKTKTTAPSKKSNVAKSTTLNKKRKFNWKIAVVIGVILAAALGYLFVRLSKASNFIASVSAASMELKDGARRGEKNGNSTIEGPGRGAIYIAPGDRKYVAGGTKYRYSTIITDREGDGDATNKEGASISVWACDKRVADSVALGGKGGAVTLTVDVTFDMIKAACTWIQGYTVRVSVPTGSYFTSVDVTDLQSSTGVPYVAPGASPAPQTPAPSTPPPAPVDVCATQVNGLGNQGPCVTLIQAKLKQLGYNITAVDGIYGTNTRDNVKIFQQKTGLAQDGIVGPITWKRLVDTKSCSDPAAKSGCTL